MPHLLDGLVLPRHHGEREVADGGFSLLGLHHQLVASHVRRGAPVHLHRVRVLVVTHLVLVARLDRFTVLNPGDCDKKKVKF